MKQTFKILIALMLCLPTMIFAQQREICGTDFTAEMEARQLRNIANAKLLGLPSASRAITYLGIKFHLVGNNDGSSRVSEAKVFEALCKLNENYLDQDVQFYLIDMYDMNNTVVNSHSNVNGAQFQMTARKSQHNNAINVFVCSSVNTSSVTQGITLGYYSPSSDIIVLRANQMNTTSTTFTHEMGHFLSLPHPFVGWEGTIYHDDYSASNPPPAALNGRNVELADGSNCSNSADNFCDTAPDYGLGFLGGNNCTYSAGAVDPTGALINPDETLYMSYFNDNCQNNFSNDQKAAIAADIVDISRNYIQKAPTSSNEVTAGPVLDVPLDNGATEYYDQSYLIWNAVPNATRYLVQVGRNANFSAALIVAEEIVSGTQFVATNLNPNTLYYWRIMAFNDIDVCGNFSTTQKFTSGGFPVGTNNVFSNTSIQIQPNVVNEGNTINLNIKTEKPIDATINIVNMAGQVVKNVENTTFQSGTTTRQISTTGLAAGVYIVNLQSAQGQINERLVITK